MSDSTPYRAAVFGATSAIASETLRSLLADRPAEILLIGRNAERLETLAADLRARGAKCEVHATDLLDPDAGWDSLLSGKEWDLFLIAHGSLPDQDATLADPHATGREIDVNLISPIRIAAACAAILEKQQKGTLAVFGSVAGDRGRQSNYLYGATKAAQMALARSWQAEAMKTGPKVSIVTPLPMPTATRARFFPGEDRAALTPADEAAKLVLAAL